MFLSHLISPLSSSKTKEEYLLAGQILNQNLTITNRSMIKKNYLQFKLITIQMKLLRLNVCLPNLVESRIQTVRIVKKTF